MALGNCAFCGQRKDLIDAHIIPFGIFKRMRGNGAPLKYLTSWSGDQGEKSRGFIDKTILCGECDNGFSSAEHYFMEYLTKNYSVPGAKFNEHTAFIDTGFDYGKFKLAILFMLWKSSVSDLEQFGNVKLSPAAMMKLQKLLSADDPGNRVDFPIVVRRARSARYSEQLTEIILDPVVLGDSGVEFLMFGWQFLICIEVDCTSWEHEELAIQPNRLIAIDFDFTGTPEESNLLNIT